MPRAVGRRLDAARALARSLRGSLDIDLADPAELSQPATVQEFGQRQQQLSDRAEHCLQGTLRDRALLREVEKLLRNVELDTDLEGADSQPDRRVSSSASSAGSSSAGYLQRPPGTVLRGGALSARRATTSLRAGAAPQQRPSSAREAAAQASGTQGQVAAVPEGVVARRLAHCDALQGQLQSVQLDFEAHWSQRLDAAAAGHARLQRQVDAALDISEEEMAREVEKLREAQAEAEAEAEAEEFGAGARAAASALGRYLAGQQRSAARGRQPACPTERQAAAVSRRPVSVAQGGVQGGAGREAGRGAARGMPRGRPRPQRVPEGHEESSIR